MECPKECLYKATRTWARRGGLGGWFQEAALQLKAALAGLGWLVIRLMEEGIVDPSKREGRSPEAGISRVNGREGA
jgi:hypothetical protein